MSEVVFAESLQEVARSRGGRCVTVGTFDGVHIGHRALFSRLVNKADEEKLEATVVTFKNHPAEVVAPQRAPKLLTPWVTKRGLIAESGVDMVVGVDFDSRLAGLSGEEFVSETLAAGLQMKCMMAGPTFGFGARRQGSVDTLRRLSGSLGFELEVVEKVSLGGRGVSSSTIRKLIEAGLTDEAAPLLGRDFSVCGTVGPGAGRGRDLGFATANLDCDPRQILPADGVYAASAAVGGKVYAAAVSVGPQPTFGTHDRLVEAHLLGHEGDLYGERLEVAFKRRLRAVRKFAAAQDLAQQIRADVDQVREIVIVD